MNLLKRSALAAVIVVSALLCSCSVEVNENTEAETVETTAVETTAAETTAVETTAAETTAAETTAAETTAAETTAAETTAAETTATETDDGYVSAYPDGYKYSKADLSEYATLGQYKGLSVEVVMDEEMPEEELTEIITYYRMQYSTVGEPITNRAAILTDTVNIDYLGTLDGVAFEGGTGNAPDLILGSGSMIPGFEEGIVGMNVGDVKTIDVTFPESYHSPDLAGKDAQFKITLNSIAPAVMPEYNDEFISSHFASSGLTTTAEFEQYFKDEYAYTVLDERHSALLEILVENSTVNGYPEGLVDDYMNQQLSQERFYADSYGIEFSEYVDIGYQMTLDEYYDYVEKQASEMISKEILIFMIAKAENITVSAEDISEETANYLVHYGYETEEELIEDMGISEELFRNSIEFSLTYTAVMDLLMENTTFIVAK